jgi:DNA-binding MarR family transcriptional regulator
MVAARRAKPLKDPLGQFLSFQLRRASSAIMLELTEALKDLGIRFGDASIILLIKENPGCSQSQIGRALNISRTNLVPAITTMIEQGWIERRKVDGRTRSLHLSAAGQTLSERIVKCTRSVEARFFAETPGSMLDALKAILVDVWTKALLRSSHRDDDMFMHIKQKAADLVVTDQPPPRV